VIRSRVSSLLLAVVMTMVVADGAHGHILSGEAAGFASGFAHLISGLDHIIAMVAVGLWGAQLGSPAIWLLPVTFPMLVLD
jgi:urease accessory protein